MSFYETPVRRLCIVRACGAFVLALGILALSFTPDVDAEGRNFCYVGAGLCVLAGLFQLWRARRSAPDETVTPIPDRAPVPEQVLYYRRMLSISVFIFPIMTAWVAYDLHRLETGATEHVSLWAPLVPLYEHFGYWPTVLSLPVIGILCIAVFRYKLGQLPPDDSSVIGSQREE